MSSHSPKDPGDLSLRPSSSANIGAGKQADFSNVRGQADTVPANTGNADFSNVQGRVDTVPADTRADTYTVQKGDTLSAIAHKHYGKASKWHAIFDANRDQLDDPDRIRPGQVLTLPSIQD